MKCKIGFSIACHHKGNEKGKRVIDARIENLAHFPDVHNGMEPPSWERGEAEWGKQGSLASNSKLF